MNLPDKNILDLDLIKKLLFISVFIEANKLQAVMDRHADQVSSKQWLLLAIAGTFKEPPSLSEVAEGMSCSRQNVKKIAAILEKKGYVKLEKEIKDHRTVCIVMTDKYRSYSATLDEISGEVLGIVFGDFSEDELRVFLNNNQKLENGIEALDHYFASHNSLQ